jgi:hypothetical protein
LSRVAARRFAFFSGFCALQGDRDAVRFFCHISALISRICGGASSPQSFRLHSVVVGGASAGGTHPPRLV